MSFFVLNSAVLNHLYIWKKFKLVGIGATDKERKKRFAVDKVGQLYLSRAARVYFSSSDFNIFATDK